MLLLRMFSLMLRMLFLIVVVTKTVYIMVAMHKYRPC